MDNNEKQLENDIAAVAKRAGVSPSGTQSTPASGRSSGLVFEFDTPDPFAAPASSLKNESTGASGAATAEKIDAQAETEPELAPEKSEPIEAQKAESAQAAESDSIAQNNAASPSLQSAADSSAKTAPVSIFDTYSGGDSREIDTQANIRTTYVPKFTGASENYRMKDDPRPRKKLPEQAEHTVAEKVEPQVTQPEAKTDSVDPTAELDVKTEGVIVSMDKPVPDENSEVLNVYKFKEAEEQTPAEPDPEEDEAELKRLLKSLGRLMDSEREMAEEKKEEERSESAEDTAYSMPDPDREELHVHDFEAPSRECYTPVDPDGLSDTLPEMPTRRTKEFVHRTQRDSFKDKFLDSIMSQRIRLVALCLFFITIVVYEILADMGKMSYEVFESSTNTGALAAFDLLIITCMFAFALPEMIGAVKSLIAGKVTPELTLIVAYIVSLSYLLVVSSGVFTNYPLFGSVFAVFVMSTVVSSYYRTTADFTAFKLISRNKEKWILDRKMTRELPEENMALDGLIDEYKSRTARLFRVGFITDFFKKTSARTESSRHTVIILSVSLGAAIIAGAVAFFTLGSIFYAVMALNLVFLLGVPAFSVLSHRLSYHDAQAAAHFEDSTVIGEKSYLDFSDVDVIAFEDTEIFGPDDVVLKRFMLYGDSDNMEQAMRQMCALFGVVGGPLHFIFSNSLDTRMRTTPASHPIIEEDGLSGDVGGRRICAGNEEYMRRHGIAIPEGALRGEGGINTMKIMYAAEDGEIFAKFYIRYSFSEEFTMLLPTLKKEGIVPLIYTGDPNVSNELLKVLSAGADCMRVVKRLSPAPEDEKLYSRVSAGVVTYGDKINAIDVLLLTKKYKRFIKLISRLEIYGLALGTVLGCVLAFSSLSVPVCFMALWQLILSSVLRVSAARCFSKDRGRDKKDD